MEFPRLQGNLTIALDSETKDDGIRQGLGGGWAFRKHGYVTGWSVSTYDQDWWFPIRQEGGGNLDERATKRWLKDTLKQTSLTVVMANRVYDEGWLRREDIPVRAHKVYDVQSAAPLLDEYRRKYSLDGLAKVDLGRPGKDTKAMFDYAVDVLGVKRNKVMENLWRLPARIVEPYAKNDSRDTFDLWQHYEPLLREQDLWGIFELETALLPVLLEMRWRGIRVAGDEVEQAVKRMKTEQAVMEQRLQTLAGRPLSVWAEADLKTVFKARGLIPAKTPTGKDSFRASWLAAQDDEFARGVLAVRRLDKARSTFLEGYVLDKAVNGRVHGELHPQRSDDGGAVTGRFSASNPNTQNLPARDKTIKQLVRGAFLPEEGEEWAACDYSQQEPRLTVYYAARTNCKGGIKAARRYMENPDMDYHQFMADITGMDRDRVKPINLGVGYGMGGAKLCRSLGLPTEWIEVPDRARPGKTKRIEVAGPEGQAVLDQYHENAPFIRQLTDGCQQRAKDVGHIRTLLGRRARLSDGQVEGRRGFRDFTYKAMNRLIQGSAADQTKAAMVACFKAGLVPLVSVHDELGFSIPDHHVARQIKEIMEHCVELDIPQYGVHIPSMVDVELGPNWGAAASKLKSEQEDDAAILAAMLGTEDAA